MKKYWIIIGMELVFFYLGYLTGYQHAVSQNQTIVAGINSNSFNTVKTSVYYVHTKKDLDKLDKELYKRNGKIVIEIINGTVKDKKGNGVDSAGYYIYYNPQKFKKGDKVQTVFVYNPESNYTDDILYRIDTKIK